MANVNGTAGNDNLIGTEFGDWMQGFGGDDIINGGTAGFDVSVYWDRPYGFTFNLGSSSTAVGGGGVETDTLIGIDAIYGTPFNDTVNVASDFTGEFGAWGMYYDNGNGSDDTIIVDPAVSFRITYQDAGGGVHADLGTGTATGLGGFAGIGNDTLVNVTDVTGTSFDDLLVGSNNASVGAFIRESFAPRFGNDTILGGGGIDRLDYRGTTGVRVDMLAGTTDKNFNGGNGNDSFSGIEWVRRLWLERHYPGR